MLSSDDEELASFQSQLCHENNNEFSNPGYLFDDDLPEISGRKKSNVTNECDVNFLPQQAKKKQSVEVAVEVREQLTNKHHSKLSS